MLRRPEGLRRLSMAMQTANGGSHSSAEAEVRSLDAGLRMGGGIPALVLRGQIFDALSPNGAAKIRSRWSAKFSNLSVPRTVLEMLEDIDHVPPTYPMSSGVLKLVLKTMSLI